MKKKLLILFPSEWLAYSPTLLNLVKRLKNSFEIKVIAIDNGNYQNDQIQGKEFEFIKLEGTLVKIINRISTLFGNYRLYELYKTIVLYNRVRKYKADEVVAVDAIGLFIAQKIYKRCHFLSLELYKNFFFRQCKIEQIESVIIQTQERYNYLFDDAKLKTFFIQNAPAFQEKNITHNYRLPHYIKTEPAKINSQYSTKKVIYFGSAIPRNGIYMCLEAISKMSDMSLTIKGTISPEVKKVLEEKYGQLLASKKIVIDNSYVEQEDIINYLSKFYIGFCFYDLSCTDKTTRFNFISVPSGKLFNYYAAAVPVIGSDILGLNSVKDFQAGILLKKISIDNVTEALKIIDNEHQKFQNNCLKAAKYFDFDKALEPFQNYLLQKKLTIS